MGEKRNNRTANFTLASTNVVNLLVQAKIAAAADLPFEWLEAGIALHYRPGEQASDHYDFLDPSVPAYARQIAARGQRIATALVYLNDGYEGGETNFPRLGVAYRGRKGDALVFMSVDAEGRPDARSLHAGTPPSAGEKWVFSNFVRNRPRAGAKAV